MTPEEMLSILKEFYTLRAKTAKNSNFITTFLEQINIDQISNQELIKLKGLYKRLQVHKKEKRQRKK